MLSAFENISPSQIILPKVQINCYKTTIQVMIALKKSKYKCGKIRQFSIQKIDTNDRVKTL